MDNANNSSTYVGETTENKTETNTGGFLYSSDHAEDEKPVQQAVIFDKNTEAPAPGRTDLVENSDLNHNTNAGMNPNPGTNASGSYNANQNPNPNVNINGGYNANLNPNPNPYINGGYNMNQNPNPNANINGGYNPNMSANMNANTNPNSGYNPNMKPNMNANPNGGYNPNMNANPNGGYNPNMNQNMYQAAQNYRRPKKEVADYTSKFDEKDISENKLFAMLPYLLGVFGMIIALLAAKTSDYVKFHVRQSIKLTICSALLGILTIPFAVMALIPVVGILFRAIVMLIVIAQVGIVILNIVAFMQVCNGKAKEPAIVGEFKVFS